jgi:hypothetical protein
MALLVPDPPDGSLSALRTALGALAARGQFGARAVRRARPKQLTVTTPQQVFTLGVTDLVERPSLKAAQPTAWRYLVEVDKRVVAAAETNLSDGGSHTFSNLNHGPFVAGTIQALDAAERIASSLDAEVRLLHIPALYFVALWLLPVGQTDDDHAILVPVAPAPPGIEANRAYAATKLLPILAEQARSIPALSADDQRGGA